jgi:hypothetical protein
MQFYRTNRKYIAPENIELEDYLKTGNEIKLDELDKKIDNRRYAVNPFYVFKIGTIDIRGHIPMSINALELAIYYRAPEHVIDHLLEIFSFGEIYMNKTLGWACVSGNERIVEKYIKYHNENHSKYCLPYVSDKSWLGKKYNDVYCRDNYVSKF